MASPVCRDAGSLCDQAGLSCTPHRLAAPFRPYHQDIRPLNPDLIPQNPAPMPIVQVRPASRAKCASQGWRAQSAGMRVPFAVRQAFPARRTVLPTPACLPTLHCSFRPARALPFSSTALNPDLIPKNRTNANSAGKPCLKSKVCEPGMASPVRRDAGSLCGQADLSCTTHRLTVIISPHPLPTHTNATLFPGQILLPGQACA